MKAPPALCYHRIGGPLELGVTRVSQAVFERQMRALANAGWRTLTMTQFAAHVGAQHGAPLHDDPAPRRHDLARHFLLTFDDGYASLAEYAYPVLADLGFTATTFLITDYVNRTNGWDARYTRHPLRHLDWDTVEHWRARGFDFGSHTATHPRLTWLPDDRVQDELERSRQTLVRRLGPQAGRAVAYPFGAWNPRIAQLAATAGYELALGGVFGNGRPHELPRVPVYLWDVGDTPFGLRRDVVGSAGRLVAFLANRCAVGTSVIKGVRGRVPGVGGRTV